LACEDNENERFGCDESEYTFTAEGLIRKDELGISPNLRDNGAVEDNSLIQELEAIVAEFHQEKNVLSPEPSTAEAVAIPPKVMEQEPTPAISHPLTMPGAKHSKVESATGSRASHFQFGSGSLFGRADERGREKPVDALRETSGHARSQVRADPRERGNLARLTFTQRLVSESVAVHRVSEKRYRTQSGLEIGIAYASEQSTRPELWFLGLADERFDIVVLLCETVSGGVLEFILPPKFVRDVWASLSRSRGEVKFHVLRKGNAYRLRIPGGFLLPIGEYLGTTEAIK
jgi:hypothetical protein